MAMCQEHYRHFQWTLRAQTRPAASDPLFFLTANPLKQKNVSLDTTNTVDNDIEIKIRNVYNVSCVKRHILSACCPRHVVLGP